MFGLGVEVARQVADVLSAVGQEGDLLVGGHVLGAQRFPASAVTKTQPTGIGDAVLDAADDEAVQVLTRPAEHRLQDGMQPDDRGRGRDEQAPPDQRANPGDHRPQLINGRGVEVRYRSSSDPGPGWMWQKGPFPATSADGRPA